MTLRHSSAPGRFTLVVLAAGRSSRMGRVKANLKLAGRTALERIVEAARGAGVESAVIVVGDDATSIRQSHPRLSGSPHVRWVTSSSDAPMSESLRRGVAAIDAREADAFFFQPVDVPLVRPEDFRALAGAFAQRRKGKRALVPSHDGRRGHPVLCDVTLIGDILSLTPDQTPRDLLRRTGLLEVPTPNDGVLLDMDTPEEYRELKKRAEG